MSNSTWQKIFIGSILILILGSIEFYDRIHVPILESKSRIESRASELKVEIARREKFMSRVRNEFGTIKIYQTLLSEREEQIRFSLPDEFSTNQALELIDRASRKSEIQMLNLNFIEENPERLIIRIECVGDFFSLNNFFREIQNSGRISTIKILEFNSGNQLRDKFPEDWIRYAKIDVTFFKFSGEE